MVQGHQAAQFVHRLNSDWGGGSVNDQTLSIRLAQSALAITPQGISSLALTNAKTALLDTLGVTLAGSLEAAPRTLMKVPGILERGPSAVLGARVRTSALSAALVNGTASHALDFDDVNIALGGHPSAPIVSALLAASSLADSDGLSFLTAFIAGLEAETRIARGVNFHHYEKGWHPTATLGVFGAATACGVFLKLTEAQLAIALSLAASMSSGLKANFGTMAKPLHVGHCARNGLLAALLAREGFTSAFDAFEHHHGYLNLFNGEGHYDVERMLAGWGAPYDIEDPGLGIKLYPCCGSAHSAIDCMLDLLSKQTVDPSQVERIDVRIHQRRLAHINNPKPQTGLEGKFSVQYCLARALQERRVIASHFTDEAVKAAPVRAVTSKVTATGYVNPPPDEGDHYAVDLTVTLGDGKVLQAHRSKPTGRSPDDPTPAARVIDKFVSCAANVMRQPAIDELLTVVDRLERSRSSRGLQEFIHANTVRL